jgi:hypothetical protein
MSWVITTRRKTSTRVRSGPRTRSTEPFPAIPATCASLCVRALRAEGTRRSTDQNSSRKRSDFGSLLCLARAVLLIAFPSSCRHPTYPPHPEFRGNFQRVPLTQCQVAVESEQKSFPDFAAISPVRPRGPGPKRSRDSTRPPGDLQMAWKIIRRESPPRCADRACGRTQLLADARLPLRKRTCGRLNSLISGK